MDVGVRDTQELMHRLSAILSTANIAMPNNKISALAYKEVGFNIKSYQEYIP